MNIRFGIPWPDIITSVNIFLKWFVVSVACYHVFIHTILKYDSELEERNFVKCTLCVCVWPPGRPEEAWLPAKCQKKNGQITYLRTFYNQMATSISYKRFVATQRASCAVAAAAAAVVQCSCCLGITCLDLMFGNGHYKSRMSWLKALINIINAWWYLLRLSWIIDAHHKPLLACHSWSSANWQCGNDFFHVILNQNSDVWGSHIWCGLKLSHPPLPGFHTALCIYSRLRFCRAPYVLQGSSNVRMQMSAVILEILQLVFRLMSNEILWEHSRRGSGGLWAASCFGDSPSVPRHCVRPECQWYIFRECPKQHYLNGHVNFCQLLWTSTHRAHSGFGKAEWSKELHSVGLYTSNSSSAKNKNNQEVRAKPRRLSLFQTELIQPC